MQIAGTYTMIPAQWQYPLVFIFNEYTGLRRHSIDGGDRIRSSHGPGQGGVGHFEVVYRLEHSDARVTELYFGPERIRLCAAPGANPVGPRPC